MTTWALSKEGVGGHSSELEDFCPAWAATFHLEHRAEAGFLDEVSQPVAHSEAF